jgi:uncharacterized protein YggT (Ycf19 family)
MTTIVTTLLIFIEILQYVVFFDVILSWLKLLWLKNIRPNFIANIIDPIYEKVRSIMKTNIWPLDLTPIVVILLLMFLRGALLLIFWNSAIEALNLLK